jgi:hypothetical protein
MNAPLKVVAVPARTRLHDVRRLPAGASAITRFLAAIALMLLGVDIALQVIKYTTGHERLFGLVQFFDLDQELNAPSYFSGLILILSSLLLGLITALKTKDGSADLREWALLCAGFLLMGADEMFSYHERFGPPLRELLGRESLGPFHYTWVLVGIPVVAMLGLYFARFLLRLPGPVRARFVVAGAVYVSGVLGVEMIGGWYREGHGQDLLYNLIASLEEFFEMAGVILFIRALLMYIAENYRAVRIEFEP